MMFKHTFVNANKYVLTPANYHEKIQALEKSFVKQCKKHHQNDDSFTQHPAKYSQKEVVKKNCNYYTSSLQVQKVNI